LPFADLPYGVTVVTAGASAAHPVQLADNMQRMLAKTRPQDRPEAVAQVFDKVFSVTQQLLSAPGNGKALVWPLLHSSLLPAEANFRQQLSMTIYALYLTCSRLGADRLRGPDNTVATASIFPHVAGNLPSWKGLLHHSASAVSGHKALSGYMTLLMRGALLWDKPVDSVSEFAQVVAYLPLLETAAANLAGALGSKRLILVGFEQEPPSEAFVSFLEQSQISLLLINKIAYRGDDEFRVFLRVGYPLMAEALHDLAFQHLQPPSPMEGLVGPGLALPSILQGMMGPFVQGSDSNQEGGAEE